MLRFAWFPALGVLAGIFAAAAPGVAGPVDPAEHWPLPPGELEQRLATDPIEVLEVGGRVGGVMGVKKLKIRLGATGPAFPVKWKRAPDGDADGWNNTPRKEIAAYEIQKWFLDPENYVVPTIVARCIPLDAYARIEATARPNLAGSECVMGALVVWLEKVTVPKLLFDEARFAADPLYARHLSDFNVLTYLIEHEDGREGNFLVSELDEERRIFSIDNGVAFGARVKNWFVPNWDEIRVPALRAETVARLRNVGSDQLSALGVLAELRADEAGVLRPVPPGPNANPKRGSRTEPGWIQLGLKRGEIDAVAQRLAELLARVDAGKIGLY